MAVVTSQAALELRYGIASRAMSGEVVSGDVAVVARRDNGHLFAAIDGVGHGEQALVAARTAADVLHCHASEPVAALIERCHVALRGTRGVAMAVAAIHAASRRLTWVGVGNVQGLLRRRTLSADRDHEVLLQRAGLVGAHLPRLHASTIALRDGDVLALATDGLRAGFANGLVGSGAPQDAANRALESFGTSTDDALVIVARLCEGRL